MRNECAKRSPIPGRFRVCTAGAVRGTRAQTRWSAVCAAWLAAATLASWPVAAQQTGTVTGVIRGEAGNPLSGASVTVGGDHAATTREDGRYQIAGVPAGTHTVSVTMIGYAVGERGVTVAAGETVTVDFDLDRKSVV